MGILNLDEATEDLATFLLLDHNCFYSQNNLKNNWLMISKLWQEKGIVTFIMVWLRWNKQSVQGTYSW